MPLFLSVDRRPVYFGQDGKPLSYGRIFYYNIGSTVNKKTVYSDRALTTPASNSQLLDVYGRTLTPIYLGEGDYTIVAKKYVGTGVGAEAEGSAYWELDNQWDDSGAVASAVATGNMNTVDTIAELRAIDPPVGVVTVMGYNALGDKEPTTYYWDADSVESENYGTFIKSDESVTGAWIAKVGDVIDCKIFGIGVDTTEVNSLWTAYNSYCTANGKTMHLTEGVIYFNYGGSQSLNVTVPLIIEKGCLLSNNGAGTVLLQPKHQSTEIKLTGTINSGSSVGTIDLSFPDNIGIEINPDWFFADFMRLYSRNDGANTVAIHKDYTITATSSIYLYDLRIYNGKLTVDHSNTAIKVNFWDVQKTGSYGGIDQVYEGTCTYQTTKASMFSSSQDFGIIFNTISNDEFLLDANSFINLTTSATYDGVIVCQSGYISAGASLTVTKVDGEYDFFESTSTANKLIVTGMPFNPNWVRWNGSGSDHGYFFACASVDGSFGAIDYSDYTPFSSSDTMTFDQSGNALKIKGMQSTGGTFKFNRSNPAKLTFIDCDITTACVGSFIDSSDVEFINTKITNTNYYTLSNTVNYGGVMYGATGSQVIVNNSVLSGSRVIEASGSSCLIKGSQVYGNFLYTATGNIDIEGTNMGCSSTIYFSTNNVIVSANGFKNIIGGSIQNANLYISNYSDSLENVNISGVRFQSGLAGSTEVMSRIILGTNVASTTLFNINVNDCSFGGSGVTLTDSIETDEVGSGSWNASAIKISIDSCKGGSYYDIVATKGVIEQIGATMTITSGSSIIFSQTPSNPKCLTVGGVNLYPNITGFSVSSYNGASIGEPFIVQEDIQNALNGTVRYKYVTTGSSFSGSRSIIGYISWELRK